MAIQPSENLTEKIENINEIEMSLSEQASFISCLPNRHWSDMNNTEGAVKSLVAGMLPTSVRNRIVYKVVSDNDIGATAELVNELHPQLVSEQPEEAIAEAITEIDEAPQGVPPNKNCQVQLQKDAIKKTMAESNMSANHNNSVYENYKLQLTQYGIFRWHLHREKIQNVALDEVHESVINKRLKMLTTRASEYRTVTLSNFMAYLIKFDENLGGTSGINRLNAHFHCIFHYYFVCCFTCGILRIIGVNMLYVYKLNIWTFIEDH